MVLIQYIYIFIYKTYPFFTFYNLYLDPKMYAKCQYYILLFEGHISFPPYHIKPCNPPGSKTV